MPSSKRAKEVHLTKTGKKEKKTAKDKLIESIRECLDKFSHVYVFAIHNIRSNFMNEVRHHFLTSRFFIGKNKVMQVALGKTDEDEQKKNIHLLSQNLKGTCGVFFTNEDEAKVIGYFEEYKKTDYARSGFKSNQTVEIPEGPCSSFVGSQESYLREKLGLPTSLKKGVVHLEKDYTVCKEGDELTPEQAKILKLLDIKMSDFYLDLICVWSAGKFKQF